MAMAKVDLELKKAFTELQEKQIETTQKVRITDIQIENHKRNKQHAVFTEREVTALDANTKMYESVGRMFVLTPPEVIKGNLKKKQNAADEKIKTLENTKSYLEKSMKEAMDNLRELVQQKKDA